MVGGMEVVKELCVSTAQMECYMTEKNLFHLNLNGFFNDVSRPTFLSVKDVFMPPYEKNIEFSIYYGVRKSEYELRKFSTVYRSFEELASFISQCANMSLMDEEDSKSKCGNLDPNHKAHVCDRGHGKAAFKLSYQHGRFFLENGIIGSKYLMTVMSCDLARILCLKDVIKSALGPNESYESCKKSIRLDGCAFLGETCSMGRNEDKLCLFEFDDLIDCKTISHEVHGRILFSFDMINNAIVKELGMKRMCQGAISYLKFRLLKKDFTPFEFCCDLRKNPVSFVIQFLTKL